MINRRASTQWDKASISFQNYQEHLKTKTNKFDLDLVDLLFISNFKGGNATINEPCKDIKNKLKFYTQILISIEERFNKKELKGLSKNEVNELINLVNNISELSLNNSSARIDGFGVSYLSALLNSFFPQLIPILDRRVLINLALVEKKDLNSQQQIKQIYRFYPNLIRAMYKESYTSKKSLRELDKEIFIRELKFK